MPGMRLDVLLVGPNPETPAANPIGVLEVKGTWRGGAAAATAEAATQASGYVAALHLAGWSNTSARDTTGYLDTFRVAYRCGTRPIYDDYVVTGMPQGVVLVSRTASQTCDDGKRDRFSARDIDEVQIPETDIIPAPRAEVDDSSFARDYLDSLPCGCQKLRIRLLTCAFVTRLALA
jgi:hypothetical protein